SPSDGVPPGQRRGAAGQTAAPHARMGGAGDACGRGAQMKYEGQEYYEIEVVGIRRRLPVVPITDSLWIAAFVLWGDVELTNACARALAARLQPRELACGVPIVAHAPPRVHLVERERL